MLSTWDRRNTVTQTNNRTCDYRKLRSKLRLSERMIGKATRMLESLFVFFVSTSGGGSGGTLVQHLTGITISDFVILVAIVLGSGTVGKLLAQISGRVVDFGALGFQVKKGPRSVQYRSPVVGGFDNAYDQTLFHPHPLDSPIKLPRAMR